MWCRLQLTMIQAEYRVERACQLPDYLGSTLRGVLGLELQAASCLELTSPCKSCGRRDRCAYGALFEAQPGNSTAWSQGPPDGGAALARPASGFDQPRPYVVVPPSRRRGNYKAGETIRLGLTLVGTSRAWSRWVVAAMAGIAQRGIGVERQKLKLVRISAVGPGGAETDFNLNSFGVGTPIPELEASQIVARAPAPNSQALISFITPGDLQRKGKLIDRLDGPTFFRRLIRRIGTLVESYCPIPFDAEPCDFRALADLADKVTVSDQNIKIEVWERYSNRNEGKHPLSGLVGQALIEGIAELLWPYLILGQWVHVGKGASFGQGRYELLTQSGNESQKATGSSGR